MQPRPAAPVAGSGKGAVGLRAEQLREERGQHGAPAAAVPGRPGRLRGTALRLRGNKREAFEEGLCVPRPLRELGDPSPLLQTWKRGSGRLCGVGLLGSGLPRGLRSAAEHPAEESVRNCCS